MSHPFTDTERDRIEARLGYRFRDPGLLVQAFTHASFANAAAAGRPEEPGAPRPPGPVDYDRLEFLGDAVIGFVLAERAFRGAPLASSGSLTLLRARLERRSSLAAAADRLDLGRFVRLSEGEARQGGARRRRLLADLFEAIVGALYLDGGMGEAERFLEDSLTPEPAGGSIDLRGEEDPKSTLQERLQGQGKPAPSYRILEVSGPSHAPVFLVEVEIGGAPAGRGVGGSRREAESEAARVALSSCTGP